MQFQPGMSSIHVFRPMTSRRSRMKVFPITYTALHHIAYGQKLRVTPCAHCFAMLSHLCVLYVYVGAAVANRPQAEEATAKTMTMTMTQQEGLRLSASRSPHLGECDRTGSVLPLSLGVQGMHAKGLTSPPPPGPGPGPGPASEAPGKGAAAELGYTPRVSWGLDGHGRTPALAQQRAGKQMHVFPACFR